MKLNKLAAPVIGGSLLAFSLIFNAFGSSVAPGSLDDPVVTKSYVDRLIGEVSSGASGSAEISEYQMEFIINEVIAQLSVTGGAVSDSYSPVSLMEGQLLIGGEGTEIILRSGQAAVYAAGVDGLADVTTGADMANGAEAGRNHLLIVPRDDGRGVRALSNVWLLVKGGYRIID